MIMRILAGLLVAITLCITACGKKGPLIYPDMLTPAPPTEVTVRQSGRVMKLSFNLPQKDRAGRGLKNLAGVMIFKRAATTGQAPGCNACTADFTLFRKLFLDLPLPDSSVQRFGNRLLLLDGDVRIGDDYTYAVTPFTQDAIEGQPSLPVKAAMVQAPTPPLLKARPEPTEIQIAFSAPLPQQGKLIGYNLYRAIKGEALPLIPLNREPLFGKSYIDIGLGRNTNYVYAARTVVMMPNGDLVESELSSEVVTQLANE
jgi:predicted small lipoprotein YifL